MPFIDLEKADSLPAREYDCTIIGAGAAGILLAIKLARKGFNIRLFESGHFNLDEERQKLNEVQFSGKPMNNAVWGRKRVVGGTTVAWGGQSLPFREIDFQQRTWMPESGWPITHAELARYYDEANLFMKIDTWDYDKVILKKLGLNNPFRATDKIDYHVSKWAPQPDFFKQYRTELDKKVDVYYNATLQSIQYNNNTGEAEKIEIANFAGNIYCTKVSRLVIATGGIETVRIMLLNANAKNDWIGKCFMDHPCIEVGEVIPVNQFRFQQLFNIHFYSRRKYSIRLSLSAHFQEQKRLLNSSASFMFQPPDGKFDPYSEIKELRKKFEIKKLLKLSKSVPDVIKSAVAFFSKGFYYRVNSRIKLALMLEQEPSVDSFISVGSETDRFGKPKANIHWNISEKTWETAVVTCETIKELLRDHQLGKVVLYDHINKNNTCFRGLLSDVNHHMGGTRMSTSPHSGVVNKDLKVWNVSNLYLCSSSVFPTGSHSNPTLTLLALTCRLSEHLQKSINKEIE